MITSKWEFGKGVTDVLRVRRSVGFSEDALDEKSIHLVIYDENLPCGTGSICFTDGAYRITYLCVLPEMQRQYVGDLMIRLLLVKGFNMMAEVIRVTPLNNSSAFFEKYGFEKSENGDLEVTPETLVLNSKCGHDCSQCVNKSCKR